MELSKTQAESAKKINSVLFDSNSRTASIAGYAGSGKTTISEQIALYAEHAGYECQLMAPTWKAARVLYEKTGRDASSIHSKLYGGVHAFYEFQQKVKDMILTGEITEEEAKERFKKKQSLVFQSPTLEDDTAYLIDEGSLIGGRLMRDLMGALEKTNSKVCFFGDPGQLPPVGEQDCIEILRKPTVFLSEIMRHKDGTDISYAANLIREKSWQHISYIEAQDVNVIRGREAEKLCLDHFDIVLCPTNAQRVGYNQRILDRDLNREPLLPNDKIIMQENKGILINSEIFTVESAKRTYSNISVDENPVSVPCFNVVSCEIENSFNVLDALSETDKVSAQKAVGVPFNLPGKRPVLAFYAHALTCHKAQGSEFPRVLVDFRGSQWLGEKRTQWLYTAITRAKESVTVVI